MDEPLATTEESKKITSINKNTIHRICSGQVVFDLAVAVKELVENSLDSGATSIEIKLIDYGKTCITVIDNGCGVMEKDFEGLGLKHHTSKLREFSDLLEVDTFGFRGEALSSLCSLSNLSIVTRHDTYQHGYELEFDKNGIITNKKECARQQGTTVHVKNIFKNLPVRAKEFEKNIKKEYAKMIQVLYSYCLTSTGVKIICTNSSGNKSANIILSTNGAKHVLDNITRIFGRSTKENLIEIEMEMPDKDTLIEYNLPDKIDLNFTWHCFVSNCSRTAGRSCPDRQFFYVNGRPCDPTKISKLINNIFHKYNHKQYPFIYLNILLDKSCADVNVTPDKRTILFTQEQLILATLKSNFERVWNNVQTISTVKTGQELNLTTYKRINSDSPENSPPLKKRSIQIFNHNVNKKTDIVIEDVACKIIKHKTKEKNRIKEETTNEADAIDKQINEVELTNNSAEKPNKVVHNEENSEDDSEIKTRLSDVQMVISLDSIKTKLETIRKNEQFKHKTENRVKYKTELNSKSSDVEKEFEKELSKQSFEKMQIIGQFNLGFILTKLDNDIFIIDQHASDEKFRFEKLSNETKLKTQKLLFPKPLNLAALNETILIENQHIFEKNGFTFCIKNEDTSGHRIHLTGIPVSFQWQFGQEDIEELIFLLQAGNSNGTGTNEVPRPSRVRDMLASRACRSAVMIGKALSFVDMSRLLTQMSQMKNPWACPHGRPTIRHLLSMTLLKQN